MFHLNWFFAVCLVGQKFILPFRNLRIFILFLKKVKLIIFAYLCNAITNYFIHAYRFITM